jgi:DNA adenine methylase
VLQWTFQSKCQGQFNVPFGSYKNPEIINEIILRAVSNYLNTNDITFLNIDFEDLLKNIKRGTFIYLDPPYDPVSDTAAFTAIRSMALAR